MALTDDRPDNTGADHPERKGWLAAGGVLGGLFAALVAMGGSAFGFIRIAVDAMPPATVAIGRLWIGAAALYVIMRVAGRRLPPLFVRSAQRWRIRRSWKWMIAVGVSGNVAPFFLFPWAQQYIESGLAGIYMAFMPIWTIVLAYFFAGEALNARRAFGFAMGFAGVAILIGPEVLKGVFDADLKAQAGLLLATLCYAVSAVLARRAPPIRPRVFSAGMMIAAACAASPALLVTPIDASAWSPGAIASVLALGVFCTGLTGYFVIILVRRVSAGFMALANYLIPVWAVIAGVVLFGERLSPNAVIALAVVLAGVAIDQRAGTAPPTQRAS